MEESRTAKSIKNSSVALVMYFINLVLQFYSRKIFLDYLGVDVLGLNTTAMNILQFLNLSEMGISSAVAYSLYKPLADKDVNEICQIVHLNGLFYKRIATAIIVAAAIVMCFFPIIFRKISLPIWYAYASFGVLLFSSLLGYFVNYKQILLTADQKDYKIQYSYKLAMSAKVLLQIVLLQILSNPYVWWLITEAIFAVIGALLLHITVMRNYKYLSSAKESFRILCFKYPEIIKKIKQVFVQKISGFVLFQSSPIIIYGLSNLALVSLYGNYLLITQGLISLLAAIFNSMVAGIGNLVATTNTKYAIEIFDQLFSIRFYIISIFSYGTWLFADTFVSWWIGTQYVLPKTTLLLMILNFIVYVNRYVVYDYLSAYGFFGDVWASVTEAVLNISLSILLGIYFGLNGVLSGVLISSVLISGLWKPYYLFHIKLKTHLRGYFKSLGLHLGILLVVVLIVYLIKKYIVPNSQTLLADCFEFIFYVIATGIFLLCFFPPFSAVCKRILNRIH